MVLECDYCHAVVNAELVASYEDVSDEEGAVGRYSFLKCPKCSRPFLTLEVDFGPGWDSPLRLFPPVDSGLDIQIPSTIRSSHEEARLCFKAEAYTATAIMCRKALEAIAHETGVQSHSLSGALDQMRDKGAIDSRLYQWADALRVAGNRAAHDVGTSTSSQDAKDILDFTTALLEYVFTFQRRFVGFMARRPATPGA